MLQVRDHLALGSCTVYEKIAKLLLDGWLMLPFFSLKPASLKLTDDIPPEQ